MDTLFPYTTRFRSLIGKGARARHDADLAAAMDVARHAADLAFAGRDHAGAVRADQAGLRARERALDLDHVEHRAAIGDADHQRDIGVDRFPDPVGSEGAPQNGTASWRERGSSITSIEVVDA